MTALFLRWTILGAIFLALSESAGASQPCGVVVGKFVSIEGSIELEHADQEGRQAATLESALCQDDMIHVGENSRATVSLINEVVLRLDQNTTMRLVDVAPQPEKRSILELIVGAFKSFSRPPRTFAVNTPYINGFIEGTEFAMRVTDDSSMITVYEGKVATVNDKGKITLKRGESAIAQKGQAPRPYLMAKPGDAVQWTLYFLPLSPALSGGDQQLPKDASPLAKETFDLVARNDIPGALARLERVPAAERNANYHTYRAALFLQVGRADEARADIDAALKQDPKADLAYALRAVIEIARNERQQALASAEKAISLKPSAAAQIALSYAQQSTFQLEAARNTLLDATNKHPNDALAWARLAELWLMFGDREKAFASAHRAAALAPGLAKIQTVLGFAALAEDRVSDARTAFERAIKSASSDPLAHFGLGLTKIKRGDLIEGRREIEAAVALDSSNALLRSYLGKAYYEEKRAPLEGLQFDIAKELDPADPTPYLYGAIDKQTTNRPVEALADLQKSIELNGNRSVYRSRERLDSDLAARSASIARIYSDLGFQQRALVEGWQSVNIDPSDFSAHRFLADSYSALPRHEIARVSELLQSQLLQPINATPIQPRLAESNLFLIGAGGPGSLSFNEFNPIFERNGVRMLTSGMIGENNTYAGEGVLSGIYDKVSFSLGYSSFASNGWRENADQKDDIANAFLQYELTPDTSIQTEYRHRKISQGDLQQRFFPEDFFNTLSNEEERHSIRLGVRHNLSPNSTILGSYAYQNSDIRLKTNDFPEPGGFIDDKVPQQASSGELQHLYRSQYLNLRTGGGYFDVNRKDATTYFSPSPPPDGTYFGTQTGSDVQHANVYSYADINFLKQVTATLGLSFDSLTGDQGVDKDRLNPKFGITWTPIAGTTLRAAAFKVLKRTLITDQTLEPTQVAGFNQFFDDVNLTEAWRYGGAIDQKFSSKLFGGVEISKRDLTVPITAVEVDSSGIPVTVNRNVDWNEYLDRAYLYWTPHPWLALRAQYIFERFERDVVGPLQLDTHRVPLGMSFFHPNGLSSALTVTYWNQNGTFTPFLGVDNRTGNDEFWTVDASISYRLPKRYGFVSVGATNLFDQNFNYFEVDFNNPTIHPGRMAFARLTLAVP